MNTLGKRVLEIIEIESVSVRSFERNIGASNGLIRKSIKADTDISSYWLGQIIKVYPKYSAKWLLTGQGEMYSADCHIEGVQQKLKNNINSCENLLADFENQKAAK